MYLVACVHAPRRGHVPQHLPGISPALAKEGDNRSARHGTCAVKRTAFATTSYRGPGKLLFYFGLSSASAVCAGSRQPCLCVHGLSKRDGPRDCSAARAADPPPMD